MTDILTRIARRDGMDAAAKAYDAGMTVPIIKLPASSLPRRI